MRAGRINLRLEPDLIEAVKELAERRRVTMSELVRSLLLLELEREERLDSKDAEQI